METPTLRDEDLNVALAYAAPEYRPALEALFMLDAALGDVVRRTSEPLIGRMRLAWWDERLSALDTGERLPEPVLAALAASILPKSVSGAALSAIVDGWEALLDPPPLGAETLSDYAAARGGRLFELAARVLGEDVDPVLGERWALVDLATHATPGLADQARAAARLRDPSERAPKMLKVLARLASIRLRRPVEAMRAPIGVWEGLRATWG